jgi:hypothetical protein
VPVPLPALLPDAGEPGVLLAGWDEPRLAPDWVPVASAPLPETAEAAPVAAHSKPINSSEVILMFIGTRLPG